MKNQKRYIAALLTAVMLLTALLFCIPASAEETEAFPYTTRGYVLAVSSWASYDLPNGLSMFYFLADGTFLIFDGGYGNGDTDQSIDATHLYDQLHAVAQQNGVKEIVVSAWVFTHPHGDHYSFMSQFFRRYASEVKVKEFWFNPCGTGEGNKVVRYMNTYYPATPVRQLVLGESIRLADVVVDVLCTPEAIKAYDAGLFAEDSNNYSLVLKLHIGSQQVLMTGDAPLGIWKWMEKQYPADPVTGVSKLKCTHLQVPHHGSKNAGTIEGYKLVDPEYAIIPAGQRLFVRTINPSTGNYQASTKWIVDNVDSDKLILAGELLSSSKDGPYKPKTYEGNNTIQRFITSDLSGEVMAATPSAPVATVRTNEGSMGIRFTSQISKAARMALREAKSDGEIADFSFGTLILPADSTSELKGCITDSSLDAFGIKYQLVPAKDGYQENADGSITIRASLVNIKTTNYQREFLAIPYTEILLPDGSSYRIYADYDEETSCKSLYTVAGEALSDIKLRKGYDEESGMNYVTQLSYYYAQSGDDFNKIVSSKKRYSPYTMEVYQQLEEFVK